ncbi:hypothetical protein TIFTF001_003775 [Ficus carica]|uniref:Uncharacterized protein n=1 Tax=Ficus carica TaxID=3494 RepID=A0AA87ZV11_FICCA|nr:hypothetical protein TIFTF001_003774 [Ficus carica]GMN32611.1 hypothetical protein TIFTF001_003775 [Ficus carica]
MAPFPKMSLITRARQAIDLGVDKEEVKSMTAFEPSNCQKPQTTSSFEKAAK